ncbi:MAG: hypothetical protein ACYC0Y_21395 [Pirellulales bacterium]
MLTVFTVALAFSAAAVPCGTAAGYTPNSPPVKASIDRAIGFLESPLANDARLGAQALVGLALVKNGAPPTHPKILAAVKAIREELQKAPISAGTAQPIDIYSAGLSVIFLVALDPSRYRPEIESLLAYLGRRQKPHGGWGYDAQETGDTSMTQYGVLSSWEATQVGFRVPMASVERVTLWLLKTQDPSGGFGYQGVMSSTVVPVRQSEVRHSLTAAGLGSLYILTDLLAMKSVAKEENLPPALKEVRRDKPEPAPRTQIPAEWVRVVQTRGNAWMQANYKIDAEPYTHYYLYALERYHSFREKAEHRSEAEPKWYNDGAEFLIKTQQADGSWKGDSGTGLTTDTAFGVLFLLRSSKKSIERARDFGAGVLLGGRGLPKDTDRVELRSGNVVPKPLLGPAENLLGLLEQRGSARYDEALEALAELPADEVRAILSKHAGRLRQLAGGTSPQARLAAVRALGRGGDLDEVPTLIAALSDANAEVAREARDSLRRISRKFSEIGPPDEPTEEERRKAIDQWKAWYRSIRPDADFEE